MNEYFLDAIAQSNNTATAEVKREIEAVAEYCSQLQGMQWDEMVAFCAASAVLASGCSDIFAD